MFKRLSNLVRGFFSLFVSAAGVGLYGQTVDHPLQVGDSVKSPVLVKHVDPKFSRSIGNRCQNR